MERRNIDCVLTWRLRLSRTQPRTGNGDQIVKRAECRKTSIFSQPIGGNCSLLGPFAPSKHDGWSNRVNLIDLKWFRHCQQQLKDMADDPEFAYIIKRELDADLSLREELSVIYVRALRTLEMAGKK